jgi:hypothetical protein
VSDNSIVEYTPEPWSRQLDEGWRDFEYFCAYRDATPGERRMSKIAARLGVDPNTISIISKKNKWKERIELYQEFLDKERREIMALKREVMYERHAALALQLQDKISEAVTQIEPSQLSPSDIAKWLDISVKVDNLAHGTPTEHVKDNKQVNVNVTKTNNTAQVILDANSAEKACDLLEQLAFGQVISGRISDVRDGRPMDAGKASGNPEQKTS